MKKVFPLLLGFLVLGGCSVPTVPTVPTIQSQAIVRFKDGLTDQEKAAIRTRYGAKRVAPLLKAELWDVDRPISDIQQEPSLLYAQPNYVRRLQAFSAQEPRQSEEWHLSQIHAPQAWSQFSGTPGAGVTVAVVDSGVDPNHPDLQANLLPLVDEVKTDLLAGTDYVGRDGQGHGTHVCGIIAAAANGIGVVGVAPGVKILPVKVMKADGNGDDFTIAQGLKDAVDKGAQIINLSVGGTEPSSILADAVAYASEHDVLMVVSAGNDGGPVNYPAAYPGVLAVGSVDKNGVHASYSSYGPELSMVAPGGTSDSGVLSTLPTYACYLTLYGRKPNDYGTQAGTSMATPQVTAAAALLLSKEPSLKPAQLRERLMASTVATTFSDTVGFGLLDVARALLWVKDDGGPQ